MATATAAACSPSAPPAAPVPTPPAGIALTEPEIGAIARILWFEDRRDLDPVGLSTFLSHESPQVRSRAASAIARIRLPQAFDLLVPLLADSSPAVRADAAFAVGILGDTTPPPTAALLDLVGSTGESDTVIAESIGALARLARPEAGRAIETLLRHGAPGSAPDSAPAAQGPRSPIVLKEALLAISRFPRGDRIATAVVPYLDHPDGEVRWRAAFALSRIRDPLASPRILDALGDEDPRVRTFATLTFRPETDGSVRRADLLDALAAALSDPHPHVRIGAAGAIARYPAPGPPPALLALLGDPDANVASAAAEALAQFRSPVSRAALIQILDRSGIPLVLHSAALAALAHIDPIAAGPHARTLSTSPAWLDRLHAVRSLAGANGHGLAGPILLDLARDPDPRVQRAAVNALADMAADSLPAFYIAFVERLGAGDPDVRAAAIRGLASRASPADLPLFLEAYGRAIDDTTSVAALAAVNALGDLAARGVPAQRVFHMRFPPSPDPVIHRAVANRLGPGAWGRPTPATTGHDEAFYLHVVRSTLAPALEAGRGPELRILTPRGDILLRLDASRAPITVHRFLSLVDDDFFRDLRWHRVVPRFVIQGGDPRGDGTGGPGFSMRDEINSLRFTDGTLGMAHAGPDTAGSQFFITRGPQPHLDGGYTAFGRVIDGFRTVEALVQDDPILSIRRAVTTETFPPIERSALSRGSH